MWLDRHLHEKWLVLVCVLYWFHFAMRDETDRRAFPIWELHNDWLARFPAVQSWSWSTSTYLCVLVCKSISSYRHNSRVSKSPSWYPQPVQRGKEGWRRQVLPSRLASHQLSTSMPISTDQDMEKVYKEVLFQLNLFSLHLKQLTVFILYTLFNFSLKNYSSSKCNSQPSSPSLS